MSNLWVNTSELGIYSDTEFAYDAAKAASNLLWALSGRKYSGVTTVTERYMCASRTRAWGPSKQSTMADIVGGSIVNIPVNNFDFYDDMTSDGLSASSRLRLRGRPIIRIDAIRDRLGKVISPNAYTLVDHSTIQPVVGSTQFIPCDCEVTYTYGAEPPPLGRMAAKTLAMEFAKLWNGEDCALPQRVTNISRQGISYTVLDPQDFVDELRTGMYIVDLFLKSVNPDKARARSRVFTPDLPRARRATPKEPKLGVSVSDIAIFRDTSGYIENTLAYLNASFLQDAGWIPSVVISNYSNSKTYTLASGVTVSTINEVPSLRVTVKYSDAFPVLGMIDPGTWDLYASRTEFDITETVHIASGNLKITMVSTTINAFTLG